LKCFLIRRCILGALIVFLSIAFIGCGNSDTVKLTVTEKHVRWHAPQDPVTTTMEVRAGDIITLDAFSLHFIVTVTILAAEEHFIEILVEQFLSNLEDDGLVLYELERYETKIPFDVEHVIHTNTLSSWSLWRLTFAPN